MCLLCMRQARELGGNGFWVACLAAYHLLDSSQWIFFFLTYKIIMSLRTCLSGLTLFCILPKTILSRVDVIVTLR